MSDIAITPVRSGDFRAIRVTVDKFMTLAEASKFAWDLQQMVQLQQAEDIAERMLAKGARP
jgi:hypothetical protein